VCGVRSHGASFNKEVEAQLQGLKSRYEAALTDHDAYIKRHGKDPEWLASEQQPTHPRGL
jgi:hypothetical protein